MGHQLESAAIAASAVTFGCVRRGRPGRPPTDTWIADYGRGSATAVLAVIMVGSAVTAPFTDSLLGLAHLLIDPAQRAACPAGLVLVVDDLVAAAAVRAGWPGLGYADVGITPITSRSSPV